MLAVNRWVCGRQQLIPITEFILRYTREIQVVSSVNSAEGY
jgi:hypothetical protein